MQYLLSLKLSLIEIYNKAINYHSGMIWRFFLFGLSLCLLIVAFALAPLPGGDDWETFRGAAQRIIDGTPLYGTKITFSHYYNAPWLAVLFTPLSLLPFRWGWSVLSVVSILNVFLLCKRWKMGRVKLIVILLSPPMMYMFLHGNIDAFVLGGVLLPKEFWPIVAVTKPQTTIALILGALNSKLRVTIFITVFIFIVSFAFFGNWPMAIAAQPVEMIDAGHNLFRGIWPFQVVFGLALAFFGWKYHDEKYLVGSSPFFSPYAATSTMLGPLMLLVSKVKNWQAVLIVCSYWIISILITKR
jgi:hypothetical protein